MMPGSTLAPQRRMKSWRRYWPALGLLLILALVAAVRIRLLSLPLERDEGEYAYAGQLMLEGVPPYLLAYNMKMPGTYASYALIIAVFGESIEGIRLGFMLVNFGAIVLLYFVGRRFLDRHGALAASAVYAVLSLSPSVLGLNAHATHFVVLAVLGAILVLLRAQESERLSGVFWSGFLFGVAFLMKQPGGAFAFFGLALVLWAGLRRNPPAWKTDGSRLALYAAGVSAPIALTGLVLWWSGVWDKLWWWTVTYARVHATAENWKIGQIRLARFFHRLGWDELFWALALAGLFFVLKEKGRANEKFFFLTWLLLSAASVMPAFHFTSHYFVLMLPLLSARSFAAVAAWLADRPLAVVRGAPWILFGLAWIWVAASHQDVFLKWSPTEATARMYPNNDFQLYPVVADYLALHSPPSATFAVLGSEPELFFYAHRRSVTGYIYMYDLVQEQPFRQRMAAEMISEVEQGRPDYVVFVNSTYSWVPYSPEGFQAIKKWLAHYTETQCDPFGVVTSSPCRYIWGPDCFRQVPIEKRLLSIYQRKHPQGIGPNVSKSAL